MAAEEGSGASGRYVLFLSRLHPGKRPALLVRAFARIAEQHPDVSLIMAGPDFGALASVRQAIAETGVATDRIQIVGEVDGERKAALLQSATCMCLPTEHEGSSVAILESLAVGVPVITTTGACVPEIAKAEAGVIVEPTVASLSSALALLLGDENKRKEMGRNAAALARERFSSRVLTQHLVAMYRTAAERAAAR